MTNTANRGTTVTVHYRGTLESGEQFDSSYEREEPISFTVGAGQMIPGFDEAVEGMTTNEKKTFSLQPAQAYGVRNEEAYTELEKTIFPDEFELEVGKNIPLQAPNGQPVLGSIQEVHDTTVVVDLNHPLAGKDLTFEVELLEVTETADETSGG